MADAPARGLDEQALDIRAGLVSLTLTFRRYRRGEFRFEPADAGAFEDQLVELGARIAQFTNAVNADLAMCSKALNDAMDLLERYVPKPADAVQTTPAPLPSNVLILPVVRRSRIGDAQ